MRTDTCNRGCDDPREDGGDARRAGSVFITWSLVFAAMLAAQMGLAGRNDRFRQLFNHYNAIRLALAADKTTGISYHADRLGILARSLSRDAMGSGDARGRADAARLRAISDAAREVALAGDIEKARIAFAKLSRALVASKGGADVPGLVVVFCPVHDNIWLQRFEDDVVNPYMGAGRARCGEVLEFRKPRWVPSRPSGRSPAEPPDRGAGRPQGS